MAINRISVNIECFKISAECIPGLPHGKWWVLVGGNLVQASEFTSHSEMDDPEIFAFTFEGSPQVGPDLYASVKEFLQSGSGPISTMCVRDCDGGPAYLFEWSVDEVKKFDSWPAIPDILLAFAEPGSEEALQHMTENEPRIKRQERSCAMITGGVVLILLVVILFVVLEAVQALGP